MLEVMVNKNKNNLKKIKIYNNDGDGTAEKLKQQKNLRKKNPVILKKWIPIELFPFRI